MPLTRMRRRWARLMCRLAGHNWLYSDMCEVALWDQYPNRGDSPWGWRPLLFRCSRCGALGGIASPQVIPLDRRPALSAVRTYLTWTYLANRLAGKDERDSIATALHGRIQTREAARRGPVAPAGSDQLTTVQATIRSAEQQAIAQIEKLFKSSKWIKENVRTAADFAAVWDERGWDPELVATVLGVAPPPHDHIKALVRARQAEGAPC